MARILKPSRRAFCFFGLGVLLSGALDPRSLLRSGGYLDAEGYWCYPKGGGNWHHEWPDGFLGMAKESGNAGDIIGVDLSDCVVDKELTAISVGHINRVGESFMGDVVFPKPPFKEVSFTGEFVDDMAWFRDTANHEWANLIEAGKPVSIDFNGDRIEGEITKVKHVDGTYTAEVRVVRPQPHAKRTL